MQYMIDETDSKELEKQQYRIVGSHSTVKVCGWTKHALKGVGGCKFIKDMDLWLNGMLLLV